MKDRFVYFDLYLKVSTGFSSHVFIKCITCIHDAQKLSCSEEYSILINMIYM